MTVSRLLVLAVPALLVACAPAPPSDRLRVSGNVEATEVHTAAEIGGRIVELRVDEGDRIEAGAVIARLDTEDTMLQIARTRADRATAVAQLRLLEAGSRAEDIRQARAQVDATAADAEAVDAEVTAAQLDLDRFQAVVVLVAVLAAVVSTHLALLTVRLICTSIGGMLTPLNARNNSEMAQNSTNILQLCRSA